MSSHSLNPKDLCLSLLSAESEDEIISILKQKELWDNDSYWRPFGDNENNWSAIGNQQGNPVAAMVEKFVNSIDAVLMKECYLRDILPSGRYAPSSISQALEDFFGIKNGNLANLTASQRSELATNIGFVATGRKRNPNYIVFDKGEGQTPNDMPTTLLSLSKSNKLRIPFVQGKFNMGGTGVLPFCGNHNLQLIISRRHPDIVANHNLNDNTADYWGFTLVRREEPRMGRRSSMFTYFTVDRQIPMFSAQEIEIPVSPDEDEIPKLEWGTIIKMYEYEMKGLTTNILFNLYYQVSLYLAKPGLPIRFYERRGYRGHTLETTLNGLLVRLQEDKSNNLEDGFPTTHNLKIKGQELTVLVYAFKKGKAENYKKDEGIIFIINGQMHGAISQRFFTRKKVNMGYLSNDLLIVIDATNINARAREDLFMNSRDRVRRGDLNDQIEDNLEDLIHNHPGLRELRERRRRQAIEERLDDSKPLQDVLDDIMRKSPTLSRLFIKGLDITNPFKPDKVTEKEDDFEGKKFPTYFRIIEKDVYRKCQLGRRFRVQFETDVVNEYFEREEYQGQINLYEGSKPTQNYSIGLWNGTATLTVSLPEDAMVNDELFYTVEIIDDTRGFPFQNEFKRLVIEKITSNPTSGGERRPPRGSEDGNRDNPSKLSLPFVKEVRQDEWDDYKFNKETALTVINSGDNVYDFFINMDNIYLKNELKGLSKSDEPKLYEARYKYAQVLIGLALLNDRIRQEDQSQDDEIPIEDIVAFVTSAICPVVLPMIDALGELDLNDILVDAV